MRQEAFEEMLAYVERVEAHVTAGRIPKDASVFPRMMYVGHECVHGWSHSIENTTFRCVVCLQDFQGHGGECPACGPAGETYPTNTLNTSHWRCTSCKHEWDGEDGRTCPACGVCA